jgi:hypothetical protein
MVRTRVLELSFFFSDFPHAVIRILLVQLKVPNGLPVTHKPHNLKTDTIYKLTQIFKWQGRMDLGTLSLYGCTALWTFAAFSVS